MNLNITPEPIQVVRPIITSRPAAVVSKLQSEIFHSGKSSDYVAEVMNKSIKDFLVSSTFDIFAGTKFKMILDKMLPMIMTPENFINKGRESKVYRISDEFVAKVKRGKTSKNAVGIFSTTSSTNPQFNQLDFYYGEPIIKVGDVEILRNATPTHDFVHCGAQYNDTLSASDLELENYNNVYLPKCASLPQESFDDFAFGLYKLNKCKNPSILSRKKYYVPDVINPNNIIIADNKFKLVDKLDKVSVKNPNSIYTMLEPLLVNITPEKRAEYDPSVMGFRKEILKKCLVAAEKVNLPLESPIHDEFTDHYLGVSLRIFPTDIFEGLQRMRNSKDSLYNRCSYINEEVDRLV